MICNNCGSQLSNTAKFCSGCGCSTSPETSGSWSSSGSGTQTSPVTALFSESSHPANTVTATCAVHIGTVASGVCLNCGNFHCRECLITHNGRNYCKKCAVQLSNPSQQLARNQHQQTTPNFIPPPQNHPYQMHVNPYVQPFSPYVKRKEPAIALLLSLLIPGLGQIYNGDVGKGVAFMIGFLVLVWVGIGIVFWIWAMIDAYQVATNINLGRRV